MPSAPNPDARATTVPRIAPTTDAVPLPAQTQLTSDASTRPTAAITRGNTVPSGTPTRNAATTLIATRTTSGADSVASATSGSDASATNSVAALTSADARIPPGARRESALPDAAPAR